MDKENNKTLNRLEDILKRWEEYGKTLYQDQASNKDKIAEEEPELKVLKSEVREAIKRLPKNKAAGYDAIPAELLKEGGESVVVFMTNLCNKVLESGKWPTDWSRSVFIPIPKTTGTNKCEKHRTIALISHSSKVLLRILLQRMQSAANSEISDVQMGFRPGVGTRDQIFNIRVLAEKCREFNQNVYLAFIDYSKAFDSVSHRQLWEIMQRLNIRNPTISIISSLYADQEAAVRVEEELTDWFMIDKGVRQGCLLSPVCFNLYTEHIMRTSADKKKLGNQNKWEETEQPMIRRRHCANNKISSRTPGTVDIN